MKQHDRDQGCFPGEWEVGGAMSGVAFVEVRTEQGELIHRFTITQVSIDAHGPNHLIQPIIDALPVEEIARKVGEATKR